MSDAPSHPPRLGAPPVPATFDADSLSAATGGRLLARGSLAIHGAAVDSRRVLPGVCFYALPGERTDGHRFLADAVGRGAAALIVREAPPSDEIDRLAAAGVTIVEVDDGLAALQRAASTWRRRFTPLVVGVTGSLAKTSTKEQVAEVLAERLRVLRNEGNENNEVGLPLTLLRLGPEHEAAVLEMGMYVPGDIAALAGLAEPSIGVVTAVRGAHLSRAGSLDAIERGKGELVEALPPSGTAVLNADDPRVTGMSRRTSARVLRYGFAAEADVRATDIVSRAEEGMTFTLHLRGERVAATTPALGRHSVHNGLAAAAVAHAAGFDAATIARGLARGFRAPHRTSLLRAGDWRVLDDSYNAAPDSMAAALELLAGLSGRRIAVLGEMLELGDVADEAHEAVGRLAAVTADRLIVVGAAASGIAAGARSAGMDPSRSTEVPDREAAVALLLAELHPGDVVLVKASRGAALDRVVDALVAVAGEPVRA